MKNSEAMIRQIERGNKTMRNSIITMSVGIALVVVGFLAYGVFANVFVGSSILGAGWLAVALGSKSYLKAKSILECASFGIHKLF